MTAALSGRQRMASGPEFAQKMQELMAGYAKLPEFIREDLVEGLLVGGGIALPVAMLPNQDAEERAAAILGGIGAATLGGAAARRIGASIGARVNPGALPEGSYGYNLGRAMGRKDAVMDLLGDMLGTAPKPAITGEEFGRALGRTVGDEVFGVAGTIGALAAAQAMDGTPDAQPGPSIGEVALGTVPGAAVGLLASNLLGGSVDAVGLNRELNNWEASGSTDIPDFSKYTVFTRGKGKPQRQAPAPAGGKSYEEFLDQELTGRLGNKASNTAAGESRSRFDENSEKFGWRLAALAELEMGERNAVSGMMAGLADNEADALLRRYMAGRRAMGRG